MKIVLLDARSHRRECINKEFMGGYGWAFHVGSSVPARLIEFVKKKGENLPLMNFGYLAAIFKENSHDVIISTNGFDEADLVIITSSMVDYRHEVETARKIRERKIKVGFIGPFASVKPELFLPYCDFIIQGEPEEIVNYCDKLGIRVTAFYLLGLPGDTEESIKNTVDYAKRLNTHVAQFFIHTPFPGTEYFEKVKHRLIEKDWEKFDCYTPVFRHENLSAQDLLRLKEWAFVSYYYRPSYAFKFLQRLFVCLQDGV